MRLETKGTLVRPSISSGVIALAAMALVVSACGSSSSDRNSTASSNGTTAAGSCPDGVVTLSVLGLKGSLPTQALLDSYTATDPCTKFDLTDVPFGQLAQKISILAPSNNPPDILTIDGPDTQSYASSGILFPLDDYLPADFKTDAVQATIDENTWDGKIYSPGIIQDSLALWYNKDMTDKAGITVPSTLEDAWTWPEARDAFLKCQTENPGVMGLAPSRLGNGTPGFAYRDLLFLRSAGDPTAPEDSSAYKTYWALSKDGKEVDGWLNTPEAIEAAKFYQGLFQGDQAVSSTTGLPNALVDKKACFDLDTTSAAEAQVAPDKLGFTLGVSPVPYFKTPIVHTGSTQLAVPSRSKHKELAAKVVVALSTGEIALNYVRGLHSIPQIKSNTSKLEYLKEQPLKTFVDEIQQWGHPRPPSPDFTKYNLVVTDALRNIAYGSDPKKELDSAVSQLTPILQASK